MTGCAPTDRTIMRSPHLPPQLATTEPGMMTRTTTRRKTMIWVRRTCRGPAAFVAIVSPPAPNPTTLQPALQPALPVHQGGRPARQHGKPRGTPSARVLVLQVVRLHTGLLAVMELGQRHLAIWMPQPPHNSCRRSRIRCRPSKCASCP